MAAVASKAHPDKICNLATSQLQYTLTSHERKERKTEWLPP